MSKIHILKNTHAEVVVKAYETDSSGGVIDISLQNDLTDTAREVYVAPTSVPDETGGQFVGEYSGSHVFISGIWWGLKKDKQLDVVRILDPVGPSLHNHYYFLNTGTADYRDHGGFVDRIYAQKDIRLIFDGPGHCILRLSKQGWATKIETAEFGIYDDVTQVGS